MNRIAILLIMLLCGLYGFSQTQKNLKMYVGTFTSEGGEGIYLCNFNTETEEISLEKVFRGIDNPSFLKISPNKKYLYAVTRSPIHIEKSGGFINAYKINDDGSLQFLNKQFSNGADPCHVDVSANNNFVAIATYGGGTVSLYPVKEDGYLMPASSVIVNKGKSINKERQTKPFAHSVKFSPFNSQVFSADLGTDQLDIYSLETDKLVQKGQKFMKLDAGSGPRHFDFHPEGDVIYVINELNSTITSFKYSGDLWTKLQTVSTLPKDFKGTSYCADIHISANGKFLYGSNRGHNSIAVFSIDKESKQLKSLDFISVEGDWPRNFALTPDGKNMLVANQKSGNITVYKIDQKSGIPEFTGKEIKIPSPVCIEFN